MSKKDPYKQLRITCHDLAFHRYGYAYIFKKRSERYKWRVNLIKTLGMIVPAIVGCTALSYGSDSLLLKLAIVVAVPTLIIQFCISSWAVFFKWDEELSYCYESMSSHNGLYSKLKHLGTFPPSDLKDLEKEYEKLALEIDLRDQLDDQHTIKDWEKRMGMKWSLREHQKKCVKCEVQPFSMKSTDCEVCGNYSYIKHQILNQ